MKNFQHVKFSKPLHASSMPPDQSYRAPPWERTDPKSLTVALPVWRAMSHRPPSVRAGGVVFFLVIRVIWHLHAHLA
jgi:hypothetical protein